MVAQEAVAAAPTTLTSAGGVVAPTTCRSRLLAAPVGHAAAGGHRRPYRTPVSRPMTDRPACVRPAASSRRRVPAGDGTIPLYGHINQIFVSAGEVVPGPAYRRGRHKAIYLPALHFETHTGGSTPTRPPGAVADRPCISPAGVADRPCPPGEDGVRSGRRTWVRAAFLASWSSPAAARGHCRLPTSSGPDWVDVPGRDVGGISSAWRWSCPPGPGRRCRSCSASAPLPGGRRVALAGWLLGGLAAFGLSRALVRPRSPGSPADDGGRGSADGRPRVWALLFLAAYPVVPFFAVSYGAGLTAVRLAPYALSTALGWSPHRVRSASGLLAGVLAARATTSVVVCRAGRPSSAGRLGVLAWAAARHGGRPVYPSGTACRAPSGTADGPGRELQGRPP